tara:strand:+ start:3140 stop:3511 length:372 start_codon:yes stop_codon:yes gene_type:complete
MRYNPRLRSDINKYKEYVIIVEGKKDVLALNQLGFEKVHAIHVTSVSLKERAEQIASLVDKKEKVCILTDLDKKGKKLYILLKPMFQELGVRLDSTLRGLLIKAQISHIEGLSSFFNKVENIG